MENNYLFESIYGKNHVGKIKSLFYCYTFRTCHLSNLVSLMFGLCYVILGFLRSAGLLKNYILRLMTDQSILAVIFKGNCIISSNLTVDVSNVHGG